MSKSMFMNRLPESKKILAVNKRLSFDSLSNRSTFWGHPVLAQIFIIISLARFYEFRLSVTCIFRHESGSHMNLQKSRKTLIKESQVVPLPIVLYVL